MPDRIDDVGLADLAMAWNLTLGAEEAKGLLAVTQDVLGILDPLTAGTAPVEPPVAAVRSIGRRPTPEEDPLNAIVRRISVKAEQPGTELAGLRVAVKDSMAIAGVPLTLGSAVMDGFVPDVDAVVIDRLLRAGAELVAVTNMDDFAFSGGGDSSAYGPTHNPYDTRRTAAGSSGGSAAALHYDGIDAALGTDQGGSIRAPAAWCGILGHKPTHALVPYTGVAGIDLTFDHVGPMTRTVADLGRMLDVLAGAHPSDPRQAGRVPVEKYAKAVAGAPQDLSGVRIGVVREGYGEAVGAAPAVVAAMEVVAERLRGLGAELVEVGLPEHETAGAIAFAGFMEGMAATITGGGNGFHHRGRYWPEIADRFAAVVRGDADRLPAQVKVALLVGLHLRRSHAGGVYARAQNQRPQLVAAYDRALEGVDTLLMPTTPGLPHLIDPDLPLHEKVMRGWGLLANTSPTDMTGHPALSMPAGQSDGLPVGAMLVGRHFTDARLLSIASTYERAVGWLPAGPTAYRALSERP